MKNRIIKIGAVSLVLLGLAVSLNSFDAEKNQVVAQEPKTIIVSNRVNTQTELPENPLFEELEFPIIPSMPGRIEGIGIYFEIKDSEYFNITLKSSEEIKVVLESIPRMISMDISSSTDTASTNLTISGLELNKTYYKYQDSYKNEAVFISDKSGAYSWTQDLTEPHHIWIQEVKGTIFLPEDCSKYGNWDPTNRICTLNRDLTESVAITADNVVLDCNKYSITGPGYGHGVSLYWRENITIQNCTITNFTFGIYSYRSSRSNIEENTLLDNNYGIYFSSSDDNMLTHNTANLNKYQGIRLVSSHRNYLGENQATQTARYQGLSIWSSNDNTIENNVFSHNHNNGIYLAYSSRNTLSGNELLGNLYYNGISVYKSGGNIIKNNIAKNHRYDGIAIFESSKNTIKDNTLTHNRLGIGLWSSVENSIINNNTSFNNNSGIYLQDGSFSSFEKKNIIEHNTINNNRYCGIYVYNSSFNEIVRNDITDNDLGVYFYSSAWCCWGGSGGSFCNWCSSYNDIYHNNFRGDQRQAIDSKGSNDFDNSYPDGGNHWSDYTGVDEKSGPDQDQPGNDGIGDTPYTFSGGQDRYPFMKENGWEIAKEKIYVTPMKSANIRSSPEILKNDPLTPEDESNIIGTAQKGDLIEIFPLCSNGSNSDCNNISDIYTPNRNHYWLKIKWNNQIGYVAEDVVMTIVPEEQNINIISIASNKLQEDQFNTIASFPIKLILSIIASETGGTLNNEITSVDSPFSGVMQVHPNKSGRNRNCVNNVCLYEKSGKYWTNVVYNDLYPFTDLFGISVEKKDERAFMGKIYTNTQYSNTNSGLESNIEDGLKVLKQKYNASRNATAHSDNLVDISKPEMKNISTVYRYNQGSPYKVQAVYEILSGKSGDEIWNEYLKYIFNRGYAEWWIERIKNACFGLSTNEFRDCLIEAESQKLTTSAFYLSKVADYLEIGVSPFGSVFEDADLASKMKHVNESAAILWLASPGELRVSDLQDYTTGLIGGEVVEDLPNSIYDSESGVTTLFFPNNDYRYEVVGTEEGTYGLVISSFGYDITFSATDIPITPGQVHQYTIDWDALSESEEGVMMKIDKDGDGEFEQTITADSDLTSDEFILQIKTVVDFNPDTLNLKSKGKFITAYIELPESFDISQIDVSSIMLNNLISVLSELTEIGDYDNDGIPDLMVKFNRSEVQAILTPEEKVLLTLVGELAHNGEPINFKGSDMIKVINPSKS